MVAKGGNLRSKKAGQEVSNYATNSVLRKDVERVVDAKPELDLGGQVARDSANDSVNDSGPCRYETRGWRDSDQTGNDTTAEANSAPLPLQTIVHEAPCEATDAGRNVCYNTSHHGTQVRGKSTTTVEAEPADPQKDCAENDVGNVVWAVWKAVGLVVASPPAEHQGVGKSGSSRRNVHRRATGEVETAELEGPAVGVPGPVSYRVIDDSCPDEDEHEGRKHSATICCGADGEGGPVE